MKLSKLGLFSISFISFVLLTACQDQDVEQKKAVAVTNPRDVKDYLIATGMELSDKIDAEDHRKTLKLLSDLIDKYQDYDSRVFDDYLDDLSDEYGFDDSNFAPIRVLDPIVEYLQDETCGSATRAGKDIIKHTIVFSKLYGKFTADDSKKTFTFDNTVKDRLEIELYDNVGNPVVIVLSGSSKTTCLHCTITDTEKEYVDGSLSEMSVNSHDFTVHVPEMITLNITQNRNSIVDVKLSSSLELDAVIDYEYDDYWETYYYSYWIDYDELLNTLSVDFSNVDVSIQIDVDGYCAMAGVSFSTSQARLENSMTINGEFIYSFNALVSGNFSNIDDNIQALFNSPEPEEDISDILYDINLNANIDINVLNKVTANLSSDNLSNLYDASYDLDEALESGRKSSIESNVTKVNNAFSSALYLNGSKEKTAHVAIDYFREDDDYDPSYYVEPILVFSKDQSSYRFEEYFTEKSFSKLIDAYDEIVNDFEDLFDRYF